ncbi:MAG: hypothetical protein ABIT09_06720 [Croceibacterium sp.]
MSERPLATLAKIAGHRRLGALLVLTVLAALTEGIGLLLLVPLLSALSG